MQKQATFSEQRPEDPINIKLFYTLSDKYLRSPMEQMLRIKRNNETRIQSNNGTVSQ